MEVLPLLPDITYSVLVQAEGDTSPQRDLADPLRVERLPEGRESLTSDRFWFLILKSFSLFADGKHIVLNSKPSLCPVRA